MRLREVYNKLK